MGGIADYSGSLVLQWPIRESTHVQLQFQRTQSLHITSADAQGTTRAVEVPLDVINGTQAQYGEIRAWFAASEARHWAAYVAGVFVVLAAEQGLRFNEGAAIHIESDVPEGKGVSSSAALEGATIRAVVAALSLDLDPRAQALLCQRAENLIVGAPCGVMDQMSVLCGVPGHLMALLCQPAELQAPVPLPDGLAVYGIDSGIRHAVTGSDYTAVRVGGFMGYRVLADLAGLHAAPSSRDGHVTVDDPRWHGYLANVGADVFQEFEARIPNTMSGSSFLARYGGTTDAVTRVDRDRCYAVWKPTAHPIYEHERVTEWARALRAVDGTPGRDELHALGAHLGDLMHQSHASYSACELGSDGTDLLVHLAREAGPDAGIYGAKITGGGSGGTVALLTDASAGARVQEIAQRYREQTGRDTYIFEA
jgi:galactokinase